MTKIEKGCLMPKQQEVVTIYSNAFPPEGKLAMFIVQHGTPKFILYSDSKRSYHAYNSIIRFWSKFPEKCPVYSVGPMGNI